MSLDFMSLNDEPERADWIELSSWDEWRDLLTETDIEASHAYSADVRRMVTGIPAQAAARLEEMGGLLLVSTVQQAMRLAVCVLRLEEIGALTRAGESAWVRGPNHFGRHDTPLRTGSGHDRRDVGGLCDHDHTTAQPD